MLEKQIEARLRNRIKAIGGICFKFESPGYTGVPDRLILLPGGTVVFAELKAPGKLERRRQCYVQSRIRKLGFTVWSGVDSYQAVDALVEFCKGRMGGGAV